ncbi:MAG: phasin family protein [Parvularcula sp.]
MSTTRKSTKSAGSAPKDSFASMNSAVTEGFERMTEGMNNIGTFGQENVDALVESASTMAKGMERVSTESADFAKKQFESGTEKFQSLASVKSPQDFFEAQSEFVRTAFEAQVEQVNKVSDMMIATARDAAQPLSKRYSALVELMQTR